MLAVSGENNAAEEAMKTISCFSQWFQSEKSLLLDGLGLSDILDAFSSFSVIVLGWFSLADSIAARVEFRDNSRFSLAMLD